MKITRLPINTGSKNYNIVLGLNILNKISLILNYEKIKFNKCLIIVDNKIPKKKFVNIKKKIKCKEKYIHFFNASEKNKSQKKVNSILNILFKKNFSRTDCIISFGGGITGDITGFAASIFKRGIKFINIPTTLLAQVDSSIGGKTGINSKFGKNLIGSFYQPKAVIAELSFLKSLPKRELVCGFAEILKYSLIRDRNFFKWIKKTVNCRVTILKYIN